MPKFCQISDEDIKIKEAEIRLTAFAVEHNISFNCMDHLSTLGQTLFPESNIAKKITSGRMKCSAIVKNVTGKEGFHNIVALLKEGKFSLMS